MYINLDLLGLVKGKPKKQGLMNLINDAKHAYFAAHCDIFVTEDEDMVKKTNFLYQVWGISIPVQTISEFQEFLVNKQLKNETVIDLIKAAGQTEKLQLLHQEIGDDRSGMIYRLSNTYLGVFNSATGVIDNEKTFFYLSRYRAGLSRAPLFKELEYVTGQLFKQLGPDYQGRGVFSSDEMQGVTWSGRQWAFDGFSILLQIEEDIHLFYFNTESASQ